MRRGKGNEDLEEKIQDNERDSELEGCATDDNRT